MALIGIVYNLKTLAVVQVIRPYYASELDDPSYALPGTAMTKVEERDYQSGLGLEALVKQAVALAAAQPVSK